MSIHTQAHIVSMKPKPMLLSLPSVVSDRNVFSFHILKKKKPLEHKSRFHGLEWKLICLTTIINLGKLTTIWIALADVQKWYSITAYIGNSKFFFQISFKDRFLKAVHIYCIYMTKDFLL